MNRRIALAALVLAVVVGLAVLLRPVVIAFGRGARFHEIQFGQAEGRVLEEMGRPDEVRATLPLECNRQPVKPGGPSVAACVREFTYYGYGSLLPEKWVIGVDNEAKVVFKLRYVSY